jgi:hypothetical protein
MITILIVAYLAIGLIVATIVMRRAYQEIPPHSTVDLISGGFIWACFVVVWLPIVILHGIGSLLAARTR